MMISVVNQNLALDSKKNNKKGNGMIEIVYFSIFVFVFVTISFYAFMAYKDVNADIQTDTTMSNESRASAQAVEAQYPSLFDGLVILLFGLLWLVVLAAAYFSDDHPLIAVVLFLVVIFVMIIGGIMSNTYDEIQDSPELAGFSTSFPMSHWLMENYLLAVGVMGVSAIIVFVVRSGVFG